MSLTNRLKKAQMLKNLGNIPYHTYKSVACEDCGCSLFDTKIIQKILPGADDTALKPFSVASCANCGSIPSEFREGLGIPQMKFKDGPKFEMVAPTEHEGPQVEATPHAEEKKEEVAEVPADDTGLKKV